MAKGSDLNDTATAFGVLVAVALVTAFNIWLVMLCAGALHSCAPEIPALSYDASGWLVALVYLLVFPATVRAARNADV
jgi:hypothetical protein